MPAAIDHRILDKLEWNRLTGILSEHAKTDDGKERCLALLPDLQPDQVNERWGHVVSLLELIRLSYIPPIQPVKSVVQILRALKLGQLLQGDEFRRLLELLLAIKTLHKFCDDFAERSFTLKRFHKITYPLQTVAQAIDQTISESGELRDDASTELMSLRKAKLALRKRIEKRILELFQGSELQKYLQDDFFTMRSERYVVPMTLDGRGRIRGSIHDASDSGQTLFIEPVEIVSLNDELLEIEVSEKIEMIRIVRELGAMVAGSFDVLNVNYQELVQLDFLAALAHFAYQTRGERVEIAPKPTLALRTAVHPLLQKSSAGEVVANDILLEPDQVGLIISGPNAGGKTVVLKTVGLLHLMLKAGLLIPASPESKMFFFENVFLELGDSQSIENSLSTFSGHLFGLKPLLENARARDLVLVDELANGTEPQTGAALAQAIVEDLTKKKVVVIVTTHFDALKALAVKEPGLRNASMQYSLKTYRPTYRLVHDLPGQSFGIELAEKMGLNPLVIARAKELRGLAGVSIDELLATLNTQTERIQEREAELAKAKNELETQAMHWRNEKTLLEKMRVETKASYRERFEDEISEVRNQYFELTKELKAALKADKGEAQKILETLPARFKDAEKATVELSAQLNLGQEGADLPGEKASYSDFKVGDRVYIVSLAKEGVASKLGTGERIDVQLGPLNITLPANDLRLLKDQKIVQKSPKAAVKEKSAKKKEIPFTLQTSLNSLDLRGQESEEAVQSMWRFLDQAILRGIELVMIIHGHGQNKLKTAIRSALESESPYHNLHYRAGNAEEGGDGVTLVMLAE